ncbi:hypothetical protein [Nocardia pseudobrasiliensis]|uniref:Lactococcin 972 family bacteriocin n=1 Tax=Nocardia pseudobrasiliensis TaxID=45979 RepID=A0A370HS44_9NOCA|nr:hypothetical protein [Nocardia pseudobrasiliensis]RDI61362.1 hypothetical protein DFR76_11487 [Nocardia pseudobrasiliensis]
MTRSVLTTESATQQISSVSARRANGSRRRISAFAAILAIATAALTAQAATAGAESTVREGNSKGSSWSDHVADPNGYRHTDSNSTWQAQHRDNRRDYHRDRVQDLDTRYVGPGGGVGAGDKLCRPHANWC